MINIYQKSNTCSYLVLWAESFSERKLKKYNISCIIKAMSDGNPSGWKTVILWTKFSALIYV